MNPNAGYQLYQIQRIKTRAEVLADDARRGRCAAAVARGSRRAYRKTLAWGIKMLNATRAPVRATARAVEDP
jgi:hypothetical protein